MSNINNVNPNNDNEYKPNLTVQQKNLFLHFESIFDKYDKNKDGKIDNKDTLNSNEQNFVNKMKYAIKRVCASYHEQIELSKEAINNLLNKSKIGTRAALEIAEQVVFQTLDKDGNGVINEKDNLTKEEKSLLAGFDKIGSSEYYIQHTRNEQYNGVNAKVTYSNNDKIIAVKTNASNEQEAANMMGLKQPLWERSVDKQTKKVRYYYKGKDELPGKIAPGYWFEWDDKSKAMLWAGNFKDIQ